MRMNFEELRLHAFATVMSIDDCPPIASGVGSVVIGRFVTREVHSIVRMKVRSSEGVDEVLEGTEIHLVWSNDRLTWVPLSELSVGESLVGRDGLAVVVSIEIDRCCIPVYNIEVHGEHVYEVGLLAILVHNTDSCLAKSLRSGTLDSPSAGTGWFAAHIFPEHGFSWAPQLHKVRERLEKIAPGLINDFQNGFWTDSRRHLGTHTKAYVNALLERFKTVTTKDQAIDALNDMWDRVQKYEWGSH
ncbi:MAG: Hint domain-containing protein [Pirellula sp.]